MVARSALLRLCSSLTGSDLCAGIRAMVGERGVGDGTVAAWGGGVGVACALSARNKAFQRGLSIYAEGD